MYSNRLLTPLMEHQRPMVEKMWDSHYFINGDDMGLGKSLDALALAVGSGLPTAIICPSGLRYTWVDEIETHIENPDVKVLKGDDYNRTHREQFIVIPYSQLAKAYTPLKGRDLIIGDEIHYVKNIEAQRTNYLHDILDTLSPERFVGLTGTLIKNRVPEFYSTLGLCSYNRSGTSGRNVLDLFSYHKFCQTFCYTRVDTFGGRKIKRYEGLRNEEYLKEILAKKYWSRASEDVLTLPPLLEKIAMVSFKEDYPLQQMWEAHVAGSSKVHFSSAKRDSAIAKAKFTADYVTNIFEETGDPVVIFSDHPAALEAIQSKLKIEMGIIDGSVDPEDRHKLTRRFQSRNLPVLGGTIGAASEGNTWTAASNLVFNDESWCSEDNRQAIKRIHRIGQNKKCVVHRVFGSKTDRRVSKTVNSKARVIDRFKELMR